MGRHARIAGVGMVPFATPSRSEAYDVMGANAARAALADAGVPLRNLRVRDLGDRARIEVDRELVPVAEASGVVAAVRDAGFPAAELDPNGFRSGSMNEALGRH